MTLDPVTHQHAAAPLSAGTLAAAYTRNSADSRYFTHATALGDSARHLIDVPAFVRSRAG